MLWPFSIRRFLYMEEKYIWVPVRILFETNKAILVEMGRKTWIAKSQIYGIRLRNKTFHIYIKEGIID